MKLIENQPLTTEEKLLILQTVISDQDRKINAYGVGGNSTQALVEEISNFDVQGVAAILSASPYYNKPTQEGIYQHYAALSQCSVTHHFIQCSWSN